MTRRIAIAILLSACAMLIVGGIAAYWSVRQTLLAELDETILERAAAVLRVTEGAQRAGEEPSVPPGDRYVVRSKRGQTIGRPPPQRTAPQRPAILSRGFADAGEGVRLRTMMLRWQDSPGEELVTMIYSTSADRFDRTMHRLVIVLGSVIAGGVGLTALIARRLSRIVMRPLNETAGVIGGIDERHLDRRIDVSALPAELAPVGRRLNEMLQRLERAFSQRRQFMIDAAHELRTPVAALRTTIEVALQRPQGMDTNALVPFLKRCLTSTRMLDRLADVLTEQMRVETTSTDGQLEMTNMVKLVQDCADLFESMSQARQIRLTCTLPPKLIIPTQPDRLRSILINLLSNAIEYTDPGGQVQVESIVDQRAVTLRVRDTGPGIDPDKLPHVFEPFYRADASRRQGEHLGLGLYLVRTHTQALGGTCSAESAPGRGTIMTVTLPQLSQIPNSRSDSGSEPADQDKIFEQVP